MNPVNDPATGCGTAKPISALSDLVFYDTSSNIDIFNKYGKEAMQPWAYSPSTKSFITFDDVWSVSEKLNTLRVEILVEQCFGRQITIL